MQDPGSDFDKALQCSIFQELQRCVQASGEPCEGSIMHTWNSFAPVPEMKSKQRNLFHLAQQAGEGAKILEVGFNAGHSVCLMMLANPTSKVVAFDLCEHHYTKPCAEALKRFFGPHRLELVEGSSANTLPSFHRQQPDVHFDLFHVDGGHQYQQALADLKNCRAMARQPPAVSTVVMDDTDLVGVGAAWEDFLAAGGALPLEAPYPLGHYKHGIGEVIPFPAMQATCSSCGGCAVYACGSCGEVRYCGETCGRAHWRRHRQVCRARVKPPPDLAPLQEVIPSDLLRSRTDGVLVAAQDLPVGRLLFEEPPLAWQAAPPMRRHFCARCGTSASARSLRCGCGQATFCESCGVKCKMCPELSITRGHVGAFTLVALEVLRDWENHQLPRHALSAATAEAQDEARRVTAAVQKVAHFCSAVRWSDQRAEELVGSIISGRVQHASAAAVGVGYYPKLARLRAKNSSHQANVELQFRPSKEHAFALQVLVLSSISEGEVIHVT